MKNLFSSALCCNGKDFARQPSPYGVFHHAPLFFCAMIFLGVLVAGCRKENANTLQDQFQSINHHAANPDGDIVDNYDGISAQTKWELQQARAGTARYRNIDNAIKDGYADIEVDVENMGHHFMKSSIVDATFDIRKPEILVYNKNDDGTQELVAVEYAVPLTDPRPEGFAGSSDVWNGDSGFPFWLLHAWVWAYNPDGVFNWTNSQVHLH